MLVEGTAVGLAAADGVARGGPLGDGLRVGTGEAAGVGVGCRAGVGAGEGERTGAADAAWLGEGDTAGGSTRPGARRVPVVVVSCGARGPGSTEPRPGTLSRDSPGVPTRDTATSAT